MGTSYMRFAGRQLLAVVLVLIGICVVPFRSVHAYVDPGSGSYLLQLLVAALFGSLFAARVFWTKIKKLVEKVTSGSFRRRQDPAAK